MTTRGVVMIGSFPPPVGGAALVNQMVLDALRSRGTATMPLDVSGPALAHSRSLGYHVQRIAANLRVARQARNAAHDAGTLYIVPDAGAGAWYTAGLVGAAGDRFDRIVVHHHSCRYIEEDSRPIAWLTERTRSVATHVFLTKGMSDAFRARYGAVETLVATNVRFVAQEAHSSLPSAASGTIRLGHLSNLCADKGFFAAANTFEAARAHGLDVSLTLAGPILEQMVSQRIAELVTRHGDRVRHLGALSGEAKRDFYRSIDLFLFPTRFRQEAAPLVIYEALAAGVPVLSTDRGVIPELLTGPYGAACARDADFASFAVDWMAHNSRDDDGRLERAKAIKHHIRAACAVSQEQYDHLLSLLSHGGART